VFISLLFAFSTGQGASAEITFGAATQDARLNRLFRNEDGWIGADGAFSIPAKGSRSWWLFSDTWVGEIRKGSRAAKAMVNNTIGRLDGSEMTFYVKHDQEDKPESMISPTNRRGWFWLASGFESESRLAFFSGGSSRTGRAVRLDSSKRESLWRWSTIRRPIPLNGSHAKFPFPSPNSPPTDRGRSDSRHWSSDGGRTFMARANFEDQVT
jgi:hypothetical protein